MKRVDTAVTIKSKRQQHNAGDSFKSRWHVQSNHPLTSSHLDATVMLWTSSNHVPENEEERASNFERCMNNWDETINYLFLPQSTCAWLVFPTSLKICFGGSRTQEYKRGISEEQSVIIRKKRANNTTEANHTIANDGMLAVGVLKTTCRSFQWKFWSELASLIALFFSLSSGRKKVVTKQCLKSPPGAWRRLFSNFDVL
jgi:hypothetical protein